MTCMACPWTPPPPPQLLVRHPALRSRAYACLVERRGSACSDFRAADAWRRDHIRRRAGNMATPHCDCVGGCAASRVYVAYGTHLPSSVRYSLFCFFGQLQRAPGIILCRHTTLYNPRRLFVSLPYVLP